MGVLEHGVSHPSPERPGQRTKAVGILSIRACVCRWVDILPGSHLSLAQILICDGSRAPGVGQDPGCVLGRRGVRARLVLD